jgi:homogentisate 1,2-dioxygenase
MVHYIQNNYFQQKVSAAILLCSIIATRLQKLLRQKHSTSVAPKIAEEKMLRHRSFEGFKVKPTADYLESRKPILVNNDCHISLAAPQQSMNDYFFKNADADELLFVHEGSGKLLTQYGELQFAYGDYLIIPRGSIYQLQFDNDNNRLFIVESFSPITFSQTLLKQVWSVARKFALLRT